MSYSTLAGLLLRSLKSCSEQSVHEVNLVNVYVLHLKSRLEQKTEMVPCKERMAL